MLSNSFFFLPLLYRFHTRKSGRFTVIPFLLTDFLPPLAFLVSDGISLSAEFFITYAIAYLAMFNCYELGYMINDAITILHEIKPTIRLTESEREFFYKDGILIAGVRCFFLIIFSFALRFLFSISVETMILGCLLLLFAYCVNNHYRNGFRFIANLLLNLSKYVIPVLPFALWNNQFAYILLFCMFPLPRFLCFFIKHAVKKYDKFLDFIQFFTSLICSFLAVFLYQLREIESFTVIFCFCFFIYRLAVFLMHNISNTNKECNK